MDIVTYIVAAEEDEYEAVGESSSPLGEWSGIEMPGMDTMKIATLHSVLTGDPLQLSLDLYEPVYVTENETIVLRIAYDLLQKLVELDEETMETVAGELAASETFDNAQWTLDDVVTQLSDLVDLAQLAESQGQGLLVWMCPLDE